MKSELLKYAMELNGEIILPAAPTKILKVKEWMVLNRGKYIMNIINGNKELSSLYDDLSTYASIDAVAEIQNLLMQKHADGSLVLEIN